MKPKLKNDVMYIPSSEGTYFLSNQSSLTLKGKHVYQWIDSLAPHLDGRETLEELTRGLSADKKGMVSQLVGILSDKGFVKDVTADKAHTLDPEEEVAYASEIAFIDYFCDSAAHRFERFRNSKILSIGSGLTLTALVQANFHSGLGHIHVRTTKECPTQSTRHYEYLEVARQRDPRQGLTEEIGDWPDDESAIAAAINAAEAIVHVSDKPMMARARMLNGLCVEAKKPFVQAIVVDGHAWIGPIWIPEDQSGCWECAWRRLQANHSHEKYAFRDHPRSQPNEFLAAPTAAIVANQLSFEIFKYLTGTGQLETQRRMIKVDLETLQSEVHSFLPHPLCQSCQSPAEQTKTCFLDAVRLLKKELTDEKTFSEKIIDCIDEELGLLGSPDERDFTQLPLCTSWVTISQPMAPSTSPKSLGVIGLGFDLGAARRNATQRACELYAAGIVDRRRLPKANGGEQDILAVRASKRFENDRLPPSDDWVWGYDPHEDQAFMVPAELAFPTLRGTVPSKNTVVGLASGFSWPEAVSKGLLHHCNKLTVANLATAKRPFDPLDLSAVPLTEQGKRYERMLESYGESVVAYDVTGVLDIPTFAFCVRDATVAYVSDVGAPEAIESGLEQVVQYHQARTSNRPALAPPEAPDFPTELRGSKLAALRFEGPLGWPGRQNLLQDRLRDQGWRVLVIPIGHDPALTDILPHLVNVVLVKKRG